MLDIEDVEGLCIEGGNKPGIDTEISLVSICGVENIPAVAPYDEMAPELAHTITSDLTLKTGYTFGRWKFRKTDATYEADTTGEEDAETVNVNAKFYMPKITPFKTYVTNKGLNNRFLVLMKDRNNTNPRCLGEVGNGVQVKVKEQSNPKNGYLVEIIGVNLDQKPAFYAGAIVY